ncbi:PML [Mytilus coruscus]|uniref:PML n=1 Tax=Mytilus coruscus TaxID=42192 RepID=A0A6J8BY46_MYTCO|nr:PML [Mytilus coruscus]
MALSTPMCGVCDLRSITEPSIIWCFECDGGLCSECKEHHSLSKGTQKHCTVPIHEYQKKPFDIVKITQTCAKHNEKYTIYCKMHERLCCGSCIVENHMECRDYDKLADVIQNTKFSNAFYEMEQSLVELSDNIQIIRNDRENNMKRLSKKKMQIQHDIKQTRIAINNHLDIIQDDIMKKLNATEVKESKLISKLLRLLKENESEIIEYRKNIENIKQHATDLQTFISMKELEKKVSSRDKFLQSVIDSENFKDCELSYNVNAAMQDLPNYIKNLGEVTITTKPCDLVLTRRKDKQAQIVLPHKSVENINLKLHKTINTVGVYIRGCCMLPDGKMAFSYYFDRAVRVLNFNGTEDFAVITPTSAFDVAYISHDDTLAVTSGNSSTKCITIIDIQSKQIKKTIPVDADYFGVEVKDKKLICSEAGKGIQLINPHNNSTTDIVRDEIPGYCYVAIFGDKMYHTNNQLNTVTCYDLQGKVKWKFKNESVLRCPCGVSVDNHGNVYVVGNSSNNVVVISADGQRHKEILTASEGLSLPCSLDYNRITNQLLVANLLDKPMIFTRT